jgi:hypothetical protein
VPVLPKRCAPPGKRLASFITLNCQEAYTNMKSIRLEIEGIKRPARGAFTSTTNGLTKNVAFCAFWLSFLLCSSRGTDLFHITAEEQLAKFQDVFRSLVSEDSRSLSKAIASFVLGNDPDGTDQVVLYDHDSFVESLTTPSSNYDHISVMVDKESLTTETDFRCRKSIPDRGSDGKAAVQYNSYIVADSEIIYQCTMTERNTGAKREARIKVSMQNVYTDEYPDGIITGLYFTNVDPQDGNFSLPASDTAAQGTTTSKHPVKLSF